MLLLVTLGTGPVMALGAPLLSGVTPVARRVYGGAVAAQLLLWAALAAWVFIPRADEDAALPWVMALIGVPLVIAGLIALAIRDERRRDGQGWVPASVLAAFPAFVFAGVFMLFGAS